MTITVHVPHALRDCCEGASQLCFSALTVRGVLEELERRYPSLYRSVCDETGAVRRHMNVFVNNSHVRNRDGLDGSLSEGLDTPLTPGDVVTILPAVSGG